MRRPPWWRAWILYYGLRIRGRCVLPKVWRDLASTWERIIFFSQNSHQHTAGSVQSLRISNIYRVFRAFLIGPISPSQGLAYSLIYTVFMPRQDSARSGPIAFRLGWLQIGLVAVLAATFFLYTPAISYQFVYDDNSQIANNPHLQSWSFLPVYFMH